MEEDLAHGKVVPLVWPSKVGPHSAGCLASSWKSSKTTRPRRLSPSLIQKACDSSFRNRPERTLRRMDSTWLAEPGCYGKVLICRKDTRSSWSAPFMAVNVSVMV